MAACSNQVVVSSAMSSSTGGGSTPANSASGAGGGGASGFDLSTGSTGGDACIDDCGRVFEPAGCIKCALTEGACPKAYAACLAEPACHAYEDCVQSCADAACRAACAKTHASGAGAYDNLYYCLMCVSAKPSGTPCVAACPYSCTVPK